MSTSENATSPSIFILTEGSQEIGFGHLRRSATLARELMRSPHASKLRVVVLTETTAENIPESVRDLFNDLPWSIAPEPVFTNPNPNLLILDLEQTKLRHVLLSKPDACRALALDWFDETILPDATVNLFDHSGSMRAAYTACGRADHYREGPDYAIIRPGILAHASPICSATPAKRAMITLGGADPSKRSIEAIQLLAPYAAQMEALVIAGPLFGEDYVNTLYQTATASFRILKNPDDFDALLASSDVVICGGGGTLLEAMYLGKAAVVLPQTAAEASHARFHVNAGAAVFAEQLARILLDDAFRFSTMEKARNRVNGCGARNIAELAKELAHDANQDACSPSGPPT